VKLSTRSTADPPPETIAVQTLLIRAGWDRKQRRRRAVTGPSRDPMGARFWTRGFRWNGRGYSPGNGGI
jgi:hypothetical protein